jgi:SpoVK/Ycf46/Vps4 family AAA+-type ATPase
MSENLLGSLYDDLYGTGNRRKSVMNPGKESGQANREQEKSRNESNREGIASAPDGTVNSEGTLSLDNIPGIDALEEARKALEEAQDKFLQQDEFRRELLEKAGQHQERKDSGLSGNSLQDENTGDIDTHAEQVEHRKTETGETTSETASEGKLPETDPMDDLNELIGLTGIKHDVKEIYDFTKIQKMRKDAGMKTVPVSMHLVFTGNPGTGKTTVARILARLYQQIGVLSKGQLVECDRSGLVAGYVGQTAVKTQKKIEEAMGGVLFIDEAYSLARSGSGGNDFGQEAIDTLLKAMEDHREDFVVIVAGYTEPMETFIQSNPGLKSRFNKFIEFPDYTVDELLQIFDLNCRKYEYTPDPEAREQVKTLLMLKKAQTPENYANAREVRNLFETIITNQARRIAALENPSIEDMQRITLDDLHDDETDVSMDEMRGEMRSEQKPEVQQEEKENTVENTQDKDQ